MNQFGWDLVKMFENRRFVVRIRQLAEQETHSGS